MHISLEKQEKKSVEEQELESVQDLIQNMNNGTLPDGAKQKIKIKKRSDNPDDSELWGSSVESFRDLEQQTDTEILSQRVNTGENAYKQSYVEPEQDMSDLSVWEEFL